MKDYGKMLPRRSIYSKPSEKPFLDKFIQSYTTINSNNGSPRMPNVTESKKLHLSLGVQLLSAYSEYPLLQEIDLLDITALCGIIRNCSYFDRFESFDRFDRVNVKNL